jgi:hypothetical protein
MFYFPRMFVTQVGLINRRAGDMRTYAQDTALPGGKYEEGDIDAEGTAVCPFFLSLCCETR